MKIFEKKKVTRIDEDDLKDAKLSSADFTDKSVKKRAFVNILGARLAMKTLFSQKIEASNIYSLYTIHSVLEDIDVADIYSQGVKIDVRLVFDQNEIFIPKSHFEYDIEPDIYLVLQLKKDMSSADFLGFFEPQDINKEDANSNFYFYDCEKLHSPDEIKDFLDNFIVENATEASKEDINKAEKLFLSIVDKEITQSDKLFLFKQLAKSIDLREKFVEFENFEIMSEAVTKREDIIQDKFMDIVAAQAVAGEEDELTEQDLEEEFLEAGININATGFSQELSDLPNLASESEEPVLLPDEDEDEYEDLGSLLDELSEETEIKVEDINIEAEADLSSDIIAAGTAAASVGIAAQGELIKESSEALAKDVESIIESIPAAEEAEIEFIEEDVAPEEIVLETELLKEIDELPEIEDLEEIVSEEEEASEEDLLENLPEETENNIEELVEENIEEELFNQDLPELNFELEIQDGEEEDKTNVVNLDDFASKSEEVEEVSEEDENILSFDAIQALEEEERLHPEETEEIETLEEATVKEEKTVEILQEEQEALEKIQSIEENEEEISHQFEDESDEIISQVDEFLQDVELSEEQKNLIGDELTSGIDIDEIMSEAIEQKDTMYSEDLQESILSEEKATEDKDVLKVLFSGESKESMPKEDFGKTDLTKIDFSKMDFEKVKSSIIKNKKMVIAASLAGLVLVSVVVSSVNNMKNKNQVTPASAPITAEGQAPEKLAQNENVNADISQQIPQETPAQTGPQEIQGEAPQAQQNRDMNKAVSDAFLSEPVNASISKIAWEVPEDLAYNDNFRKYLQMAGKNLKLNLQNNLLLSTEMAYSNKVVADIEINSDGSLRSSNITISSGSKQIDKIVLQSIKETLQYLKMPAGELSGKSVSATLIINF